MSKTRLFILVIIFLSFGASEVLAGRDGYARPTRRDLAYSILGFEGVDLSNEVAIKEFARLSYCEKYRATFRNDFEWLQTVQEVREDIRSRRDGYRKHYEVIAPLSIDRYDFDIQAFPISETNELDKIGLLLLYSVNSMLYRAPCHDPNDKYYPEFFPLVYAVYLKDPLTLTKIFMPPKEGQAFLERLNKKEKAHRVIYIRMRIRLSGFHSYSDYGAANFTGKIEQIDFFEDPETTIFLAKGPRF